jgi:hypothetical protein
MDLLIDEGSHPRDIVLTLEEMIFRWATWFP